MRMGWISKSLCLLCIGLSGGLGAAAQAEGGTPSVLDRVQRVDDPELGELLRVAMENFTYGHRVGKSPESTLEMMRKVAQSYAQVKLLDDQIDELARKIESRPMPVDMKCELVLAKAELESKLIVELANLREIMLVVPRYAFERQPVETLKTWLSLNVVDERERVYVLDAVKPFQQNWMQGRRTSVGLLSTSATLDYVRQQLTNADTLPMRIDISYVPTTKSTAEDLEAAILSLVKETKTQMEVELRLESNSAAGSGESPFFLRQGRIQTLYPAEVQRPDGGADPLVAGMVNTNDLEQHILARLTMPKNVPIVFRIEYDDASASLARQVAETVTSVAKRLGIADVVKAMPVLVQPTPEEAFLGRWQAVVSNDLQDVDIRPGGQAQLTMARPPQRTGRPGDKTVPALWVPGTKEIFLDGGNRMTYQGSINAEGNLVIDTGEITPQGSFYATRSPAQMIFKKAD